jgi:hypothetical protein
VDDIPSKTLALHAGRSIMPSTTDLLLKSTPLADMSSLTHLTASISLNGLPRALSHAIFHGQSFLSGLNGESWCGGYAIRTAIKKERYTRGVRRRKPPLSEANRIKRLNWARAYIPCHLELPLPFQSSRAGFPWRTRAHCSVQYGIYG